MGLLAVLAVVSGYVMLFYLPTTQRMEILSEQIAQGEELAAQLETKLAEQRRMEQTLEQMEGTEDAPIRMPAYDNLQMVMAELNDILSDCLEYSVSFQGEQSEDGIFRRQVQIPFTCADYEGARAILQRLHDSPIRCMMEDLQLSRQENGAMTVTVSVIFFEYQEDELP